MKNREIYDSALRFLAESTNSIDNEDYEERAPYLLAAFCNEVRDTDAAIRCAHGETQKSFNSVFLSLDSDFPLSEMFCTAASYYLAAMLVFDDDADLSDRLYDKFCDSISRIRCTVPALCENITDRYPFI